MSGHIFFRSQKSIVSLKYKEIENSVQHIENVCNYFIGGSFDHTWKWEVNKKVLLLLLLERSII